MVLFTDILSAIAEIVTVAINSPSEGGIKSSGNSIVINLPVDISEMI